MAEPKKYKIPYSKRKKEVEGTRLATFWRRGAALAIDCVIAYTILLALVVIVGWSVEGFGFDVMTYVNMYLGQVWYVQLIVDVAVPIAFFGTLMYFWNGYTVGKRIMKIRVVSLKSENITFWQSFDRAFGYTLSTFDLFFGFLRYFANPARQARHDKIVDTIVVDERDGKYNPKI